MDDAKSTVLAKYPKSYAHSWADCWCVYSGDFVNISLGQAKTRSAAWEDAAQSIRAASPSQSSGDSAAKENDNGN